MTNSDVAPLKTAIRLDQDAPVPLGSYSHAVKAAGLIFVSGQGARSAQTGKEVGVTLDEDGNVTSYDIKVQTKAVLENLKFILEKSGSSMQDLVDVSVFLNDMADFQAYNQVYAEYFNFPDPPARTTVQVAGLPGKNFIEIKAIAASR
jgi:reactive intermediate/imine deaminase